MKAILINELIFTLHYFVFIPISIVLALLFAFAFWTVWLFALFAKPFRGPSLVEAPLPEITDKQRKISEVSLEQLLGESQLAERGGERPNIDGVFEGGGVKAIAQVGPAQAIEDFELEWGLLGGTSGGAIVASLLATGKNPADIWRILTGVGLHKFVDVWYLPKIAWLQRRIYFRVPLISQLLMTNGMVSGNKFLEIMRENLQGETDELRFGDVLNKDLDRDEHSTRHRLKMVATDISRGQPIVLPDDLTSYWESWDTAEGILGPDDGQLTPDKVQDCFPLAKAVRMSMAIPFFFRPVVLHLNEDDDGRAVTDRKGCKGRRALIVDGGISSNFPIWLFGRLDRVPRWPTLGFLLDEAKGKAGGHSIKPMWNLIVLAISVINTGMGAMDKRLDLHDQYRTARLGTDGVNTTDFGLDLERQQALYRKGFEDALTRVRNFEWSFYLERFRR